MKDESGGDIESFITNGEWYLLGEYSKKKTIVRVRVSLLDGLGETRKRIASERVQKYRQSVNFCVSFLCYRCTYNCLEEL